MAAGVLRKIKSFFLLRSSSAGDVDESSSDELALERPALPESFMRPKVVPFNQQRKQEMIVVEPTSFAEAREAAEALKQKKAIVVNIRSADKSLSGRIVDFLGGISYATDGHMHEVSPSTFLFTPSHIDIKIVNRRGNEKDDDNLFQNTAPN